MHSNVCGGRKPWEMNEKWMNFLECVTLIHRTKTMGNEWKRFLKLKGNKPFDWFKYETSNWLNDVLECAALIQGRNGGVKYKMQNSGQRCEFWDKEY